MKSQQYSNIAKFFHWLIAGLIVSQYVLAELSERAEHQQKILEQLALLANHKSIGMTILILAILRIGYRLSHPAPALPSSMAKWQIKASNLSHWLLYGALFALPISGWLMSSAKSYSVSWFNLFSFPDLVSANESLADFFHQIHHTLAEALFVLALLHIAAAIKHHLIDKDTVLSRMSGVGSWLLFIATIALTLATLARVFNTEQTNTQSAEPSTIAQNIERNTETNTSRSGSRLTSNNHLAVWQIDYENSFIRFRGEQAGAPFEGTWQSWSAKLQFDANALNHSHFDVSIDTNSVFSNDKDRDDYIRSDDFFNSTQFSEAKYTATEFTINDTNKNEFTAKGNLSVKGLNKSLPLTFIIEKSGQTITLNGKASIDRLAWNIGTGDWTDTSWVGQYVDVDVRVVASLIDQKNANNRVQQ